MPKFIALVVNTMELVISTPTVAKRINEINTKRTLLIL